MRTAEFHIHCAPACEQGNRTQRPLRHRPFATEPRAGQKLQSAQAPARTAKPQTNARFPIGLSMHFWLAFTAGRETEQTPGKPFDSPQRVVLKWFRSGHLLPSLSSHIPSVRSRRHRTDVAIDLEESDWLAAHPLCPGCAQAEFGEASQDPISTYLPNASPFMTRRFVDAPQEMDRKKQLVISSISYRQYYTPVDVLYQNCPHQCASPKSPNRS